MLRVAAAQAAVAAQADAVVGDLDEPAQMHLVAHVGAARGVGPFPEGLEALRVGLAEPGEDLVVG